tara:strand:+ start:148 stop:456 length:309 start_codon:yes stop_codon:yes gene_type:complete
MAVNNSQNAMETTVSNVQASATNPNTIVIVLTGVALNLLLPMLVKIFATDDQLSGADTSLIGEMIHMVAMHGEKQLSSSLVVALLVFLSLVIGLAVVVPNVM